MVCFSRAHSFLALRVQGKVGIVFINMTCLQLLLLMYMIC